MYSEGFWITIIGVISGILALSIRYCLRSKCSNISLCYGCIQINRNIEEEVKEELELIHNENNELTNDKLKKQNSMFNDESKL